MSTNDNKIFGNDIFAHAFDVNNKFTGAKAKVKGIDRWYHFHRFLCYYDACVCHDKSRNKDPLWKVALL